MRQIDELAEKMLRKDLTDFKVGDTIDVNFTIKEESKERVQVFTGIVIGIKGHGISRRFTVRRVSYGEGVERVFPMHSPLIDSIVVVKKGKVRRAKLYYLRAKTGKKATNVREKIVQKKSSEES